MYYNDNRYASQGRQPTCTILKASDSRNLSSTSHDCLNLLQKAAAASKSCAWSPWAHASCRWACFTPRLYWLWLWWCLLHTMIILIVIVMMVSLLVCEINTNNTAISAININFIVITIIVSTNQEGAGPTISALPGWFRQVYWLQSGLPSTWLLLSSYRRSFCEYYKVISPPLDRFCLLIKDHFAYVTK